MVARPAGRTGAIVVRCAGIGRRGVAAPRGAIQCRYEADQVHLRDALSKVPAYKPGKPADPA